MPLSIDAHQQAEQLRRQQLSSRKGKQVYLNTLAVYAVHQYLECLGVNTDLAASTSQDTLQIGLSDAADLMIQGVGRLECRPILPGATVISLVMPTRIDRIGCVAVELDADLRQATLLGFVQRWHSETILLQDLEPLSTLLEYLEESKQRVNLQLWFQQVTTNTWKTVEQLVEEASGLLGQPTPALAYRSTITTLPNTIPALIELFHTNRDRWTRLQILGLLGCIAEGDANTIALLVEVISTTQDDELRRQAAVTLGKIQPNHGQAGVQRARVLELGMQLEQQRVLLVVTLTPDVDGDTEVHLRLYPGVNQPLPAHLQLSVLDEFGHPFLEEQTLGDDDWVQLVFHGTPGDRFSISLQLNEATFREAFEI
ncbi:DUF1822 family protein [Pantanalinema rosaneae]|uniref:DUF1822 family protein n=1 Tax=Pantanalinema rosaneae TaxID=1620701 RepID=UPI003D6DF879